MLAAMAHAACEYGAGNVTVAHVVERAGVSRRTFYEIFTDCQDCFLGAFDEALARVSERVLPAYESGGSWREQVRGALTALLSFLEEEPFMGRLLIVESLGAGRASLERRSRALAPVMFAIDAGRAYAKPGREPPVLTAEGVVGAVLSVLHGRISQQDPAPLMELRNPLMSMIVLPYMGAPAARRELRQPLPERSASRDRFQDNPLRALAMRLTYRTVQVLAAVASNPGSSNRRIADASGISDQGQISKLLGRLHKLDLVENVATGPLRGEPNAWRLTKKGQEVRNTLVHLSRP